MVTKIRLFFLKRRWYILQAQATTLSRQIRILQAEKDRKIHNEAERIARRTPCHHAITTAFFWDFTFTREVLQPIEDRIKALTEHLRAIEDKKREVRFKIETVRAGSFSAVTCRELPS